MVYPITGQVSFGGLLPFTKEFLVVPGYNPSSASGCWRWFEWEVYFCRCLSAWMLATTIRFQNVFCAVCKMTHNDNIKFKLVEVGRVNAATQRLDSGLVRRADYGSPFVVLPRRTASSTAYLVIHVYLIATATHANRNSWLANNSADSLSWGWDLTDKSDSLEVWSKPCHSIGRMQLRQRLVTCKVLLKSPNNSQTN